MKLVNNDSYQEVQRRKPFHTQRRGIEKGRRASLKEASSCKMGRIPREMRLRSFLIKSTLSVEVECIFTLPVVR